MREMSAVVVGVALWAAAAWGQVTTGTVVTARAEISIIPQARILPPPPGGRIEITEVVVTGQINDQTATTVMEIGLRNTSGRRMEADMLVPVPDGAVVRAFTFQGAAREPTAELLRKEEARSIYQSIVAKSRDPALLEFIGLNLIRSSVFPVEPHGTQKVRLTYECLLSNDGDRVDYYLPRTEAVDYSVPWKINITIKARGQIATVYSPTHKVIETRRGDNECSVALAPEATTMPGAFRLCYLLRKEAVTASLYAYPDSRTGGGYFLLLAGLPPTRPVEEGAMKREITMVLDRSGSMNGEKIEQVREAARQIVAGLEMGEGFNIIAYNEGVDAFSPAPVIKTRETASSAREWIAGIQARGGTNIHDALTEALHPRPATGALPIVLFLTDGLPTVGQTSEVAIRELASRGNPYNRRIFTFGVGADVNVPLLEKLAAATRARPTFVLPKEDVEVKVGKVFKGLAGPVLADPQLTVRRRDDPTAVPVQDLLPTRMPDFFDSDQVVVLGRYMGSAPLQFSLTGNYRGQARTFRYTFDVDKATVRNSFVPRLWASRKIAGLIDAIRELGADGGTAAGNPRTKELVDEIVRLSTEFGILTEYTAFLARDGADLTNLPVIEEGVRANLEARAMKVRTGVGALNQGVNAEVTRMQQVVNARNEFYDKDMRRVDVTNVQQAADRAYYRQGAQWVDSRLASRSGNVKADREVAIGSEEHLRLAEQLVAQGREAALALPGAALIEMDGKAVLVK